MKSVVSETTTEEEQAYEVAEDLIERLWKIEQRILDEGEGFYPSKGYESIRRARLAEVAGIFTVAARGARVDLTAAMVNGQFEQRLEPIGARPHVLAFVWANLLSNGAWRRIKRCEQCKDWFADRSRPGIQLFCSTACHNRWHGRERRSLAKKRKARARAKLRLVRKSG